MKVIFLDHDGVICLSTEWGGRFKKQREAGRKLSQSVNSLPIEARFDNFNKKAIYIMIREMTDVKTSKITQVTNTFRKIYPRIQEEVLSRGHIDNLRYTGSLV